MKRLSTIKVVDCTLRDGGYYTQWNFPVDFINDYLQGIALSGVHVCELGFRFRQQKNNSFGECAYTTDDFIKTLKIPKDLELSVMINASDFTENVDQLESYFSERNASQVNLVRVAAHKSEIPDVAPIVSKLKNLEYAVALNLMQIDSLSLEEIEHIANQINSWSTVDVLYFADSLGNLDSESIAEIIEALRRGWNGPLGFHSHDNRNLALSNCLAAISKDVDYLDSTIMGMGRGAGNVRTEALLIELVQKKLGHYNLNPIYFLEKELFTNLKEKYNWGSNTLYHLAAINKIHPTYMQELITSNRYSYNEILAALDYLSASDSRMYSRKSLNSALDNSLFSDSALWDAEDWVKDKTVLILGAGSSLTQYEKQLKELIDTNDLVVLSININKLFDSSFIDAYVTCYESRILIEAHSYKNLNRPIILPLESVPLPIRSLMESLDIRNYGLKLSSGQVELNPLYCVLNFKLSVAYAIALAKIGGAKKILLAGFDGYVSDDPRQQEMIDALAGFENIKPDIEMIAITPTSYRLKHLSVDELEI